MPYVILGPDGALVPEAGTYDALWWAVAVMTYVNYELRITEEDAPRYAVAEVIRDGVYQYV